MLVTRGDSAGAIEQYRLVVDSRPEYIAARVALAAQLVKAKQPDAALDQLQAAVKLDAQNASLYEQIGDVDRALNRPNEAREAYAAAIKLEGEKSDRKRLQTKMAF